MTTVEYSILWCVQIIFPYSPSDSATIFPPTPSKDRTPDASPVINTKLRTGINLFAQL